MYTHITRDDFTIFEANIHRNNKRKNFLIVFKFFNGTHLVCLIDLFLKIFDNQFCSNVIRNEARKGKYFHRVFFKFLAYV